MSVFKCDNCDKTFTTRQNMNYHVNNKVCERIGKYVCKFCGKELSSSYSLYRHKKNSCKKKKESESNIDSESELANDVEISDIMSNMPNNVAMAKIYDMLVNMKQENDQLKVKVTKLEKEPKVVNNNTTNNMNNCNINNGTVNNIYLVGYGKEDMSKIDRDDLLKGIRTGFNSTLKLIDAVHFNPKYPEFHNVYISSMKNKYAMMYDGNAWTLVMKDDLIDKMYDDKRNYIEENMDEFLDSLSNSQIKALHRWLDVDDDHHYVKKIKNDIKLLLYNKRNLALNPTKIELINDVSNGSDKVLSAQLDVVQEPVIVDVIIDKKLDVKVTKKASKTRRLKPAGRPGTKRKILRSQN